MLAIVIPYYKLTFFEETLESLAIQNDKRFKVYIGDDASLESPEPILKIYNGKFEFVYHRFETNLGGNSLTQQWERCIDLSNDEDWIMILGDDDVLGDNVVEEFYKSLEEINKFGCNVVKFASQIYDVPNNTLSKVYQNSKFEDTAAFYYKRFTDEVRSSLSEHIFKREVYLKYGFKDYPLAWHSDDMAWIDFANKAPIFSINKAIVTITVSSVSVSGANINLIQKNKAEIQFFTDIIRTKLCLFNKKQRLKLLYHLEVVVRKRRKITHLEWSYLALGYFRNFSFIFVTKFVRRYLIQLIK